MMLDLLLELVTRHGRFTINIEQEKRIGNTKYNIQRTNPSEENQKLVKVYCPLYIDIPYVHFPSKHVYHFL